MTDFGTLTLLVIVFALVFDLTNGWNDSANAIATVVSTRVLRPWTAVLFGAALNFTGALFSSEVAKTVGRDIADPRLLNQGTFLAATLIAPVWITICTFRGLPISCSHSLMGGLIGAVLATTGMIGLNPVGVRKIVFGVFTSPVIGFVCGALIMISLYWIFRRMRPPTSTAGSAGCSSCPRAPWRSATGPVTPRRPWASSPARSSPPATCPSAPRGR
jgi:PiT family inorganic phosphate transporter